ncbi:MAG: hypothetical protein HYS13_04310 [Planctomycetia bacterium]|nr:hypothetical protein [Planctomycetia bacterium]
MKLAAIYGALFLAWLVFLVAPAVVLPLAFAAIVGLSLLVLWSAARQRCQGWGFGLFFGLLLITLPLWIEGLYRAFEPWSVWPSAWKGPSPKAPVAKSAAKP